jgi:hypothetical protein
MLKHFAILILSIALLVGVKSQLNEIYSEVKVRHLIPPPEHLKLMTFGYSDMVADLLWIRLLQDFEYCDGKEVTEAQKQATADALEAADKNSEGTAIGILSVKLPPARCDKGWSYHMIDSIVDVVPRYKIAYRIGAIMLSVLVDDRVGASLIFDKGIAAFPEDWVLAYRAGYHALFEVQNPEKAANLLIRASEHGGPPWLKSLGARLLSHSGQYELAYSVLMDVYKNTDDEEQRKGIAQRLEKLRKVLQKK